MQLRSFAYIALAAVLVIATSVAGHPSVAAGTSLKGRDTCTNSTIELQFLDPKKNIFAVCHDVAYTTYLAVNKPLDFSHCTEEVSGCWGDAICSEDNKSCDAGRQYCVMLHGTFECIA
ncbi:hypothetical protein POSPLADRAFT_1131854 [Postia placenta MAD-698-R-SB12]|uniref:Uncharacterized protein n=1 Tax=Postia placenta MAD-698-R-SB12 TaxID=670580 RepID=A0A1X6NAS3_9APHY|nr:hypothetical protein POSPLADRAFT_1131854 [Postia placenta MAD-698-R-SB12]OSX65747.1 hypothetical protein POSPLADRAFT_1131854 [Postia placenta MAD-698-R-SB12]